jgi:hypothetical protein
MEISSNVGPWGHGRVTSMTASRYNARGSVTGLHKSSTARESGDAVASFPPVVVPTRVAPAQAIAEHDVVDVSALDVTTKAGCGGVLWVAMEEGGPQSRTGGGRLLISYTCRERSS